MKEKWCPNCKHVACVDCEPKKWNMADIDGLKCCRCGQQHSIECWQSGVRSPQAGAYTERVLTAQEIVEQYGSSPLEKVLR